MAVYRNSYRPYSGPLTPAWSRCLVLFRYTRRNLFQSKFQTGFFVACFFFPVLSLFTIYLVHSLAFWHKWASPAGSSPSTISFFSIL